MFLHTNTISVARLLAKRYKKVKSDLPSTEAEFNNINDTVDAALLVEWTTQEEQAQRNRSINVSAMDIYDVQENSGISFCASTHLNISLTIVIPSSWMCKLSVGAHREGDIHWPYPRNNILACKRNTYPGTSVSSVSLLSPRIFAEYADVELGIRSSR